jgi:hypothetical protein
LGIKGEAFLTKAAQADADNVLRLRTAINRLPQHRNCCLPQLIWLMIGPARARIVSRRGRTRLRYQATVRFKDEGFYVGRSQVNTDQEGRVCHKKQRGISNYELDDYRFRA